MRNYFILLLIGSTFLLSCAKSALDIDVGKVKVINLTDAPYAVFVNPAGDSMAFERYVGMLPRNAHIIVPLRANEAYELKIGEVNTGRLDKYVQVYTLEKDELIDLSFTGLN